MRTAGTPVTSLVWIYHQRSYGDVEMRLRLAYRVVNLLRTFDKSWVVVAWLQSRNRGCVS
jgi:hypothetical protein